MQVINNESYSNSKFKNYKTRVLCLIQTATSKTNIYVYTTATKIGTIESDLISSKPLGVTKISIIESTTPPKIVTEKINVRWLGESAE